MSVVSKFPSIINKKVFKYAYRFDEKLESFVSALQLSAVCQKWREDALPLFCSCAFIMCKPELVAHDRLSNKDLMNCLKKSSNIEFLKQFNLMHLARTFTFHIQMLSLPLDKILDIIIKFMGFGNVCWSNINNLKMNFVAIMSSEDNSSNAQIIEEFSKRFYRSMPSLAKMDVNCKIATEIYPVVVSIANRYLAEQKSTFESDISNLPELDVHYGNFQFQLDLKRSESNSTDSDYLCKFSNLLLEYSTLSLDWIDYILKCCPNKDHGIVEYPYLNTLCLYYSRSSDDNRDNGSLNNRPMLDLPGLEKLTIKGPSPEGCLHILLNKCCKWSNVKHLGLFFYYPSLGIDADSDTIKHISWLANAIEKSMPKLEDVAIYCDFDVRDTQFYKSMIQSFGNRVVSYIDEYKQSIKLPIFSTCLTNLDIEADIEGAMPLVSANVGTLKRLVLKDVSINFDWACLQTNSSRVIRFPALKYLSISFNRALGETSLEEQIASSTENLLNPKIDIEFTTLSELWIERCSFLMIWKLVAQHSIKANNTWKLNIHGNTMGEYSDSERFSEILDNIGHAIIKAMPHVKDLNLSDSSPYKNTLFDNLCQHYSKQLKMISTRYKLTLGNIDLSPNVKRCILIKPSVKYKAERPRIYTDSLDNLYLQVDQSFFSWTWFARENVNDAITFKNLYSFHLDLTADVNLLDQSEDTPESSTIADCLDIMPSVSISKAKKIKFIADRNITKFTPFKLKLKSICNVYIQGPINMLPLLDNGNLAVMCDDQKIIINCASKRDEHYFYKLTNGWYGSKYYSGGSELQIGDLEFELNVEKTCWKYVNTLKFSGQQKMSTIVKMLPKLLNTFTLAIDELIIDDSIQESLMSFDSSAIIPLSQSIEKLTLKVNDSKIEGELAFKALSYLLLSIPSLKEVSAKGESFKEDRIVELYGKEYPYIADLKFTTALDTSFPIF